MKFYTHTFHTHQQKVSRGFSLVELLVSVALFTIVMTVSIGTLLALVNANQKAQSLKSVINNLNFGLDSMTRSIRTGRSYNCMNGGSIPSTLPAGVASCPNGDTGLVLTDDQGVRTAYRYNGTSIERRIGDGSPWVALTAPEVIIDNAGMLFYVTGTDPADTIQPTVTISIRGHVGPKVATESRFNIQTTVTQRLLDE
jgi:prepilin-type N-terminal cleavage/methylation domain-containing protein